MGKSALHSRCAVLRIPGTGIDHYFIPAFSVSCLYEWAIVACAIVSRRDAGTNCEVLPAPRRSPGLEQAVPRLGRHGRDGARHLYRPSEFHAPATRSPTVPHTIKQADLPRGSIWWAPAAAQRGRRGHQVDR